MVTEDEVGATEGGVTGASPGALPPLSFGGAVWRGAAWGGALGGWLLACMWLGMLACAALWIPFSELAEEVDLDFSAGQFLELMHRGWPWIPTVMWRFAVGMVAGGIALGSAAAAVGHWIRLDRERLARQSLTWAVRPLLRAWGLWVVAVLGAVLLLAVRHDSIIWISLSLSWTAGILLPFMVLRAEVVLSEAGRGWWRPRWPGVGVVGTAGGLAAVSSAVDWAPEAMTSPWSWILTPGAWFVSGSLMLLAYTAFLWRLAPREVARRARSLLAWERLGPWFLVELRLSVLLLWLIGPVIIVYIPLWKSLPVLATALEGREQLLPLWMAAGANFAKLVGTYWWASALILPILALWLLARGRLAAVVTGRKPSGDPDADARR